MVRDTVSSSRPDCSALAGVVSFARPLPSLAVTPEPDPPIGAPSAFTGAVSGAQSSPFPAFTLGPDPPYGVPRAFASRRFLRAAIAFPGFYPRARSLYRGTVGFDKRCCQRGPRLSRLLSRDPTPQRGTVGSSRHCCQCWPSPVPFPLRGSAPDEQVPLRALSPLLPVASVCTPGVFPGPTQPKLGLRLLVRILTYTIFKPAAGFRPIYLCRQGVWRRRQENVNQGLSRGSTPK